MQLSNTDIKLIKSYFEDKPVLRAYLFGSFSRNDASKDSDIDILVELDYTKHIGMGFVNMKLTSMFNFLKKILNFMLKE